MKLIVGRKPLTPLFYSNEHNHPKVRALVQRVAPERATKVGEEKRATIKGAVVTFVTIEDDAREFVVRMERKKLVRLAHAMGKIGTAPKSSVQASALVEGEVHLYIKTIRRGAEQQIVRFTSVDGPFGG